MPTLRAPGSARPPLLARLRVGTKLMLLVLLPVCVLVGFTTLTAVADWRAANELQNFQAAARLSVATAGLADRLAAERTAAVLLRLRPTAQARAGLAAAQHDVNQALHQAGERAAGGTGPRMWPGRLGAVSRQLGALRLQTAAGSLPVQQIARSYSVIVSDLINTVEGLVAGRPTPVLAGRPMYTWRSCRRSRLPNANAWTWPQYSAVPGTPSCPRPADGRRWRAPSSAPSARTPQEGLSADLEGVLSACPASPSRRCVMHPCQSPDYRRAHLAGQTWLDASGTRIDGLRQLERGAASNLAATASQDLHATRASGIRDLGLLLAVLAAVAALALALRRSITRPLSEVSAGARMLSSGDLAFDVSYAGRDEIGDVATAFRDLRVTAERLAGEYPGNERCHQRQPAGPSR